MRTRPYFAGGLAALSACAAAIHFAAIARMAAIPAGVIAATTAVMVPGWAGASLARFRPETAGHRSVT